MAELPPLAKVVARTIRLEGRKVPLFAVAEPWGHQRLAGVAVAVANELPEEQRAAFWEACGVPKPAPNVAAAIMASQAEEGE